MAGRGRGVTSWGEASTPSRERDKTEARVGPSSDDLVVDLRQPGASKARLPPSALHRYRIVVGAMGFTDVACVISALVVAEVALRDNSSRVAFYGVLAVAPFIWIAVFHALGLYAVRQLSAWEEFRRAVTAISVRVSLVMIGSGWWHPNSYRP